MSGSGASPDGPCFECHSTRGHKLDCARRVSPAPGSLASEPLDRLLMEWRDAAFSEGGLSALDLEARVLRACLADAIDAFRAAGLGYAAALATIDEARALLPAVPAFEPEDAA